MQPGRATGLRDVSQSAWDLSDQKNRELQICPHIGSQIASSVSSLKIYSLNSSLMSVISDRLSMSTRTIPELPDVSSLRLSSESLASVDAEANYYTRRGTERAAVLRPISCLVVLDDDSDTSERFTYGSQSNLNIASPASASVHSLPGLFLPQPVQLMNDRTGSLRVGEQGNTSSRSLAWIDVSNECEQINSEPATMVAYSMGEQVNDLNHDTDYGSEPLLLPAMDLAESSESYLATIVSSCEGSTDPPEADISLSIEPETVLKPKDASYFASVEREAPDADKQQKRYYYSEKTPMKIQTASTLLVDEDPYCDIQGKDENNNDPAKNSLKGSEVMQDFGAQCLDRELETEWREIAYSMYHWASIIGAIAATTSVYHFVMWLRDVFY